ncbi:MAG: ATP-binding protein [Thiohalocapsa sp.]
MSDPRMPDKAAPAIDGQAALPGTGTMPAASRAAGGPGFGAVRTLRVLVVGTIILPLVLGLVAGYLSYRAAYQRAAFGLAEAAAVAEENTTKILDTHVLVAARIGDLLVGQSDAQLQAEEKTLHDRMAAQIADLPQVAAAWIIDAAGNELASARVFPVNRQVDLADREDFRALRGGQQTFIQAVRARSLDSGDYRAYFTVSQRREDPDGSFRGIIVVAVSGPYFASFYNSLLGSSTQFTATVLREDGTALARYPETAAAEPAPGAEDTLLAGAIAGKNAAGVIESGHGLSDGRLIAYRRLANYPVYVAIGRTRASITGEWLDAVAGYAAVGVPAAIGLMLLSLVALHRTRREQRALAAARDAMAQRGAIEAQLHQAQRMEAVGLLTAGIAHDFNNLLTIVAGNIALLDQQAGEADARRQRLISAARSGCERASALTKRLLGYARREPADPQRVDINEVISGMTDLPWRSLGDRVTVELRLAPDLWPVFVDPTQLEDALLNLALNARDAMAGVGRLTVATANRHLDEVAAGERPGICAGDYVVVSVTDTGCGMPPEVRDRAFDPFFTTKETGKGSGLGLSQVNGFVTRSGGYCLIDSTPGRGTTIRLHLPRHLAAPAEERATPGLGEGLSDELAAGTASS